VLIIVIPRDTYMTWMTRPKVRESIFNNIQSVA
jgi:hypothetical protein